MNDYLKNLSVLMRTRGACEVLRQFIHDAERDPFDADPNKTAYNCGYRRRAANFVADMRRADPAAFQALAREAQEFSSQRS